MCKAGGGGGGGVQAKRLWNKEHLVTTRYTEVNLAATAQARKVEL